MNRKWCTDKNTAVCCIFVHSHFHTLIWNHILQRWCIFHQFDDQFLNKKIGTFLDSIQYETFTKVSKFNEIWPKNRAKDLFIKIRTRTVVTYKSLFGDIARIFSLEKLWYLVNRVVREPCKRRTAGRELAIARLHDHLCKCFVVKYQSDFWFLHVRLWAEIEAHKLRDLELNLSKTATKAIKFY